MNNNQQKEAINKLTEVANDMQAKFLIEALKEHDIPAYKSSQKSGGVMNAYMGFSIYGVAVFVNAKDLARAEEILEEVQLLWEAESNDEFDFSESELETEMESYSESVREEGNKNISSDYGMMMIRAAILLGVILFFIVAIVKVIMLVYIMMNGG